MNFKQISSPIPNFKIWNCSNGKYSFVITLGYKGYTASWKDRTIKVKQMANRIDGSPFKTFNEAEIACQKILKQLKMKN